MDYMVKNQLKHLTIGNITDEDIENLDFMGVLENYELHKHCSLDLFEHLMKRQIEYLVKMSAEFKETYEKNKKTINCYIDLENCSYTFQIKDSDHSCKYYLCEEHDMTSNQGLPYLFQEKSMNLIVDPYRFRKYSRNNPKDLSSQSNDSFFEHCINDIIDTGKVVFICRKKDLEGFWSKKLALYIERIIESDEYVLIITCKHESKNIIIKCDDYTREISPEYVLSFIPSDYKNHNFQEFPIYEVNKQNENLNKENDCNYVDESKFIMNPDNVKEKENNNYSRKKIGNLWTLNSGIIIDITDNELKLSIYHDNKCNGGYDGRKYEAWLVSQSSKKVLCSHAKSLLNNWKLISNYNVPSDIKKYWLKRIPLYTPEGTLDFDSLLNRLLQGYKIEDRDNIKEKLKRIFKAFEKYLEGKDIKEKYDAIICFILAFSEVTNIYHLKDNNKEYFSSLFGQYFCPDKKGGTIRKRVNDVKDRKNLRIYNEIKKIIREHFSK